MIGGNCKSVVVSGSICYYKSATSGTNIVGGVQSYLIKETTFPPSTPPLPPSSPLSPSSPPPPPPPPTQPPLLYEGKTFMHQYWLEQNITRWDICLHSQWHYDAHWLTPQINANIEAWPSICSWYMDVYPYHAASNAERWTKWHMTSQCGQRCPWSKDTTVYDVPMSHCTSGNGGIGGCVECEIQWCTMKQECYNDYGFFQKCIE